MRNLSLLLLSIALFSCSNHKNPVWSDSMQFDSFPLAVPEHDALLTKWENKTVHKSMLIDDMEKASGWKVNGIGTMNYTTERAKDGRQSLRFRTSLRDEEHYRKNRSDWDSFNGGQGGVSGIELLIDKPRDWSAFNRISFWVYVHPTSMPVYCLHLIMENEGTEYNATSPAQEHFIQDLKQGTWNHVLFEIPHLERNKIKHFSINQMLTGHNPDLDGIVTYDIDNLELQLVDTEQYEGWNVSPGKFAFSHAGYRPGDPKIALAGNGAGSSFELLDENNMVAFTGDVNTVETSNGIFHRIDFSDLTSGGVYRIRSGSLESDPFPINEDVWLQPVHKAINFFFCERCGFSVPGIHTVCHSDWQGFRGDVKKIINGGWHDAGDLSQGSWRTAMSVFAMMQNLELLGQRKDAAELADLIRSEMVWGLQWLLKTRFGEGFHMSFSVMRIYTDNQTGTLDDVVSPASNVPWENFLAAAVECKASVMLEKSDPELAAQARKAAIEDWEAAMLSGLKWDRANYREASWGATSSILLGKMTGEKKYMEQALQFGNLLTRCQERNFKDGIPITGYFYENTDRTQVIHNYHASFEEAPLIALANLCHEFPEDRNWMEWYSAAVLHSEFFLKRGSQIASPYDLLPNSVWRKSEIMAQDQDVRGEMLKQFNDGTPLNAEYVLRTFPIYHDGLFHGNTNIHMSCTWALAEASALRNDSAGMRLAGKQLEWVLGANPFGQSLMYGAGYDFAPHFAYCLKDIVGSLPVGMDCISGDMPYWPATNTATTKEIWVEPVNRFLGAVSVYTARKKSAIRKEDAGIRIHASSIKTGNGIVKVSLTITGDGKHTLGLKVFNAGPGFDKKEIDLTGNQTKTLDFELKVTDQSMPYVALMTIDKDPELRSEISGSFNEPSFSSKGSL